MSDRLGIGLIGFGNHVRKNLLRLFGEGGPVRLARILVRDAAAYAQDYPEQAALFGEDSTAFHADPAISAVYIATPIACHFKQARAALIAGKHVICEKPLTWHLHEAEELAALAREKGLLLCEVAMYRHHAQFRALRQILAERAAEGERLVSLAARFTIPELPPTDIRYQAELGGGALLDVGFYPLSMAAALLGEPDAVSAAGYICPDRGVDLSGQALLRFGGAGAQCFWAIGASYANTLELHFEKHSYRSARAYSKPPELATTIEVTAANGQMLDPVSVEADDQFANLLGHAAALIRAGDSAGFAAEAEAALANARVIDRVRRAASEG